MRNKLLGCLLSTMLISCSGTQTNTPEQENTSTNLPVEREGVKVMTLTKGDFHHELVSNGKIVARESAELYFRTSEVIAKIWVKNGTSVRKGQKLAELDMFKLNNILAQRKNSLAQATLEMQDVLIGQGYAPDNLDQIPDDILKLARMKSGYESSKAQYEAAQYDLHLAVLTAPFDGVVANLFDKAYNLANTGEPFCRIISSASMEVDFTVLESELPLIKTGDAVEVMPYASTAGVCKGSISEINPLVDENGMVRGKSKVDGGGRLFDGMNVRISVKRSLEGQMVGPKTAVVLRSGKQVLFTVDKGKAMWNYVNTGLENMTEYTLVKPEANGLKEGMTVIVTGNVNLAHEAPVTIIDDSE